MICHTHNFQISGRGCQILPWSWQSRSFLTGISHGSPSRWETNSENHVWEGQNGATRRRWSPHVFTLRSTAGMSLTGGKLYSFMSGQGCASASIPREAGWERENQRGHWVVSCDLPYGSSASIPLTWVSVLTRSPPLGSGPPGHGPLSGTKTCPKKKLARMPVLGARPGAPLAIDVRHTAAMLSIPTMTCEWNFLPSGMEESDRELDEPLSTPGRLCAGWGTCLTRHGKPVVPRKPLLTQRGKHPSLSFGDDRLPYKYSTQEKTGIPPH